MLVDSQFLAQLKNRALLQFLQSMQIDRRNFQEHIDLILQDIEKAHFIAFDCQFTGLVTQLTQIQGLYPDQKQFYERIKETALNFNLLQLGITAFHFENGEYYPKAYNFYVSGAAKKGFNKIIVAEWQSMAFLAKNGMNFNTAFLYGIQYKRLFGGNVEKKTINPLQSRQYNSKVFYSKKDQQIIQEIEKIFKNEQTALINFQNKRIFDHFRNMYELSFDKPKKNMERFEYVCKIYPKAQNFFEQQTKEDLQNYINKVADVTLEDKAPQVPHQIRTLQVVISKIIQTSKPIVGHFPNLDIGLIYQAFIAQLPQTYEEFTNQLNNFFPYIFDTKIISRRLQNKMRSIKVDLKSLYKSCFNKKVLGPYANINYKYVQKYLKQESSHEAGYDSFMTGCAFISMLNYLYDHQKTPFVFSKAVDQNNLLYSKFTGEISLLGPQFTPKTKEYSNRIMIYPGQKKEHNWQQFGEQLSKYGTLSISEDHGETYYVFDQQQNIEGILNQFIKFKSYGQRAIIKARQMFS